jgi:hypothetical protein
MKLCRVCRDSDVPLGAKAYFAKTRFFGGATIQGDAGIRALAILIARRRALMTLTVDAAHAEVFDFEEFLDAVF